MTRNFDSGMVEGRMTRGLIDMLVELSIIKVGWETSYTNPLKIVSGDRAMMAFRLHGVLRAIKQRECTR